MGLNRGLALQEAKVMCPIQNSKYFLNNYLHLFAKWRL